MLLSLTNRINEYLSIAIDIDFYSTQHKFIAILQIRLIVNCPKEGFFSFVSVYHSVSDFYFMFLNVNYRFVTTTMLFGIPTK